MTHLRDTFGLEVCLNSDIGEWETATTTRPVNPSDLVFGRHVSLISSGEWEEARDQMWFRSGAVRPVEGWNETWIRADHRTATGVSAHVAALAQECALLGMGLGWASKIFFATPWRSLSGYRQPEQSFVIFGVTRRLSIISRICSCVVLVIRLWCE